MSRFSLLAILLCALPVSAEDWPEFRGPTGQGLAKVNALPVEWSKDKNVAWKQAIPGSGWSSPVIVGGKIYLTSAVPDKGQTSLQALCLDVASGKQLWAKEVFRQPSSTRMHPKNSHASPTPIVHDGRLYVHFGPHGTACLDLEGKIVWTKQMKYSPVHGNGGSPAIVDDLLVFSCDGSDQQFVVALALKDGEVRWKTPRSEKYAKGFSFGTPLVLTVADKKQVISTGSGMVGAYDASTGKEIWRVRYEGYSVIPRPVYGHGLLYLSSGYDSPRLLAIKPDGKGDVTDTHVSWTMPRNAPHTPSPLLVGDELYTASDSGMVSCLDAKTGEIHWQKRAGGPYSASPIFAAGRIYFQGEDGSTVVVKAGKEYERLAVNQLGERSLASPAVADGALFIRTASHLYRLQMK